MHTFDKNSARTAPAENWFSLRQRHGCRVRRPAAGVITAAI
ncbi:hypothetical protein GPEL0_01f2258 [Geoanaerobacter pelophilus]|uniref:Uncharacterized protein n=1 Tax=Geoanaerobacter pelophilus TaxID=60036 RepID=A0ABQ0MIC8_9BACT|nr:hypothetical protein GPEL0_01f2258 [Geoanaerobacter pelophilus]